MPVFQNSVNLALIAKGGVLENLLTLFLIHDCILGLRTCALVHEELQN